MDAANEEVMSSDSIQAMAAIVVAAATVVGFTWGLWTYTQARRHERARWMAQILVDFLQTPRFLRMREVVFAYEAELSEVVDGWLQGRYPASAYPEGVVERTMLLDDLLSYFEFMLFLEERGHLDRSDRDAMVTWWITQFQKPVFANLRLYIARWEWVRLAHHLGFDGEEHLGLTDDQRAEIPDTTWHAIAPALVVEDEGVWRVVDGPAVWPVIDPVMGHDPADPASSRRVRRCTLLARGEPVDGRSARYATSARKREARSVWRYLEP